LPATPALFPSYGEGGREKQGKEAHQSLFLLPFRRKGPSYGTKLVERLALKAFGNAF